MSMIIDGTNGLTFNNGTTQASAGNVLQVVSTSLTSSFTSSVHGAWDSVTGLSVAITPKFSTSKILVMVQLTTGDGGYNYSRSWGVARNGTLINQSTAGTGQVGSFASTVLSESANAGNNLVQTMPFTYLDSPATTSATTYQVQFYSNASSVTTTCVNRPYSPAAGNPIGSSTITVMEIAG
jgi:hypothetical protein